MEGVEISLGKRNRRNGFPFALGHLALHFASFLTLSGKWHFVSKILVTRV